VGETFTVVEIVPKSLAAASIAVGAIQVPYELECLITAVQELNPKNVMEIGTEGGGTFFAWCKLASGLKISVDLPTGSSGSWKFADPGQLSERTKRLKALSHDVHVITGDSHSPMIRQKVKETLKGEMLDFLFIDGDHSYEGVKADYNDYKAFVRPGGLIAFHDIRDCEYHRVRGCFVSDFWNELEGNKREFVASFGDWGGIGCLICG
jgi:cephalosporin hydroxylase